jgi:hypothetical protein
MFNDQCKLAWHLKLNNCTSKGRFQARLTLCLYSSIQTSATLKAFLFIVSERSVMYGLWFLSMWAILEHGTTSILPPHVQTYKIIKGHCYNSAIPNIINPVTYVVYLHESRAQHFLHRILYQFHQDTSDLRRGYPLWKDSLNGQTDDTAQYVIV